MSDVAVIIVSWNTKKILIDCIKSIYSSLSSSSVQIIVVDNNSSDGSRQAIRDMFNDVTVINTGSNFGYGKACNIGIKHCRSDFVCILNSDILFMPNCIELLLSCMKNRARIAMVGPLILNQDGSIQDSCRKLPTLWNSTCLAFALDKLFPKSSMFSGEHMTYFCHDREIDVDGLVGCFMFVRKKAIDEVGLMDETFFMYCEETDWCKRFREAGWSIVFTPKASAVHLGGASSSKDPASVSIEQIRSRVIYWKKHHSLFAQLIFRILYVLICVRQIAVFLIKALFLHRTREAFFHQLRIFYQKMILLFTR